MAAPVIRLASVGRSFTAALTTSPANAGLATTLRSTIRSTAAGCEATAAETIEKISDAGALATCSATAAAGSPVSWAATPDGNIIPTTKNIQPWKASKTAILAIFVLDLIGISFINPFLLLPTVSFHHAVFAITIIVNLLSVVVN
jgi:hypothetical protein